MQIAELFAAKAMTSLQGTLFNKLDKGAYVCRETCDVYLEDVNGQGSYYPYAEQDTVYRTGDVESRPRTRYQQSLGFFPAGKLSSTSGGKPTRWISGVCDACSFGVQVASLAHLWHW